MRINPQSLAKASATHPWRTLGIWLVVLAGAIAGSSPRLLGPALTIEFDFTNDPEAKEAEPVLEEEPHGRRSDHRDCSSWSAKTPRSRTRRSRST